MVHDSDIDTASGVLLINIKDDAPLALADTDSTVLGTATGNVVSGAGTDLGVAHADVIGADGTGFPGAVIGVEAGAPATGHTGGLNGAVTGAFGVLTIDAQGSYNYVHTGTANGSDTFTYTIKDADGSLSHATLVIAIPDSTPALTFPTSHLATVFEFGLGPRGSEPAGTGEAADGNPNNNSDHSETAADTITFTSPDGVSAVALTDGNGVSHALSVGAANAVSFAEVLFPGGPTVGMVTAFYTLGANNTGTISFTFVLTDNIDRRLNVSPTFGVLVTDNDGDTASGTMTILALEDRPIAHDDTDSVKSGQTSTDGNVITGSNTDSGTGGADLVGADDAHVVEVAFSGGFVNSAGNGDDSDHGFIWSTND